MTNDIITIAPGITCTRWIWSDCYVGFDSDLLAAGLVEQYQLPGQPGNGKCMTSFRADGSRVPQGNSSACSELGYRKVRRYNRKLCVEVSVGEEVANARLTAERAERKRKDDAARSWPFPIWGTQMLESLP